MERRTTAKVVVSVAVIVALVAAAFAHPISPSPPERGVFEYPDASDLPENADGYRLTASIASETGSIGMEGVVIKGGVRYGVLTSDSEATTQVYQPSPDAVVYERTAVNDGSGERRLEDVREDNTTELLWYENDTDGMTLVAVDSDEGDIADDIEGSASMYVNNLYVVEYERTDNDEGGAVYKPHGGWFDGAGTYHATDVSGEVRTDNGTVRSANVSWRSWRVENYAYYVLANLFVDKPERKRTTIRFEEVEEGAETPGWVERARDERSG